MRPSTAVLSALTVIVGVGGGSVAYELASNGGQSPRPTETMGGPVVIDEAPATSTRGTRFRWAPCEAPAVLRGGTCVTTVVRTVAVPGTAPVVGTTAGGVAPAPAYEDDDEGYDDEGNDDDGDEGVAGDDDEGDDDEGDEGDEGDGDVGDDDHDGDDEDD